MANQSKERWESDPRYNRHHDVDPEFLLGLERALPNPQVEKVTTGNPLLDRLTKTYGVHQAPKPDVWGKTIATGKQVEDVLKGKDPFAR